KALLFPTQVDETFGLSMIEALASGTPVIGWDNGSVAEVIQDRYTGYVVNSLDGMVKAIKSIDRISREACRERAQKFFSVEKMVGGYEKVYLRVIEEHRAKQKK
ncbi:MAG TPA: glycosyltransferase, partial [Coxiellaceae bacterium]|nr:glycosyltransferase [Coxiellaceae bacterium]